MMKYKGSYDVCVSAPEIYGYKRVATYKCEIDQEEAQRAVVVIALKRSGLTDSQIARGMTARYGGDTAWWKYTITQILNDYKYYCGRHLVYNADGEIVYPPFMT